MRKSFPIYPSKILLILLFGLLLVTSCGNSEETAIRPDKKAGTVLLNLDPIVEIAYDYDGLIMDVTGADGEALIGQPCIVAMEDLIVDLYEADRLEQEEILLTLEEGSEYHEGFLEGLEKAVEKASKTCGFDASIFKIEENA